MVQDQLSVQLESENNAILHRAKGKPVLVAFSGGPDSVFLVLWLCSYFPKESIRLIYFDHGLRSEAEIAEERSKNQAFADKMGLNLMVKKIPVAAYKKKHKTSSELAGRYLRLSFLAHYAGLLGTPFVAMAHHLDDQCETFLSKLAKGLQSGHPGIRQEEVLTRETIIWRPLINLTKSMIEQSLEKAGVGYSVDSSNTDLRFERNQIRHTILPHFKTMNPSYQTAFKTFIDHQSELQKYFQYVLDPIFDLLREESDAIKLPIGTLAPLDEFIRQRVIVHCLKRFQENQQQKHRIRTPGFRLSQSHIQTLSRAVQEQKNLTLQLSLTEHVQLTNTHFVCEQISLKKLLDFTMDLPAIPGHYVLPELGKKIQLNLLDRTELHSVKSTDTVAYLNFDKLGEKPLYVRNRRPQDQVQPFGSDGSKSLKKYMIDKKIPAKQRQEIPLFFAGNTLVWITGYQIHHDCKVTDATQKVLKVEVIDA